jgi:glycine cleavage system H protein
MSKTNPADRKYSREHEWARDDGDGTVTVGITDYAQEMLTDIVFVELPAIGKVVKQMDPFAVVESVKSVSDVFAPVGGEVITVNTDLETQPELVNRDAFGEGWIARIRMHQPEELKGLMNAADYEAMIREEKH